MVRLKGDKAQLAAALDAASKERRSAKLANDLAVLQTAMEQLAKERSAALQEPEEEDPAEIKKQFAASEHEIAAKRAPIAKELAANQPDEGATEAPLEAKLQQILEVEWQNDAQWEALAAAPAGALPIVRGKSAARARARVT